MPLRPEDPDGARVLVVEDDALLRMLLAEILRDEGFAVRTAANGAQGLDQGAAWAPDVIVLDLLMPVMDGYTFMRARDGRMADVPVVVMSAAREERRLGAAYLPKPVDLCALLDQVERLAASAPART